MFRIAECNAGPSAEDDYNSDFPKIRGFVSSKYLFSHSFGCMDTMSTWYVDFNIDPTGSIRIEYRSGTMTVVLIFIVVLIITIIIRYRCNMARNGSPKIRNVL
jgi:hypothetical protein